jgi:hypothetical protein
VLLNSQENITQSIAKQRIVFLVKHVIPWLQDTNGSIALRAEICRALSILLTLMSDLYGEHWREILDALANNWLATAELQETETESDRYGHDYSRQR